MIPSGTSLSETIFTGFLGASFSIGAAFVSAFSELEANLRIISLIIGITVGVLTGLKVARDLFFR
jgi:hypothetical protein